MSKLKSKRNRSRLNHQTLTLLRRRFLTWMLLPSLFVGVGGHGHETHADTHSWNDPSGGVWGTFTKWTPIGVPTSLDTARFDLATLDPVLVSLIQSQSVEELLISDGEIAFNGTGIFSSDRTLTAQNSRIQSAGHLVLHQHDVGTVRDINLTVENQLEMEGRMTLRDGSLATVQDAIVDGPNDATVRVSGQSVDGRRSRWEVGQLTVGLDEIGTVQVADGGELATDSAALGKTVSSGALFFDGVVKLFGTSDGSPTTWTNAGSLKIGDGGRGLLRVENGASATTGSAVIGPSSNVRVVGVASAVGTPSSWDSGNTLLVAGGDLEIENGAAATSEAVTINGFGVVRVEGTDAVGNPSTWNTSGRLTLGNDERGDLFIESGGRVFSETTEIGTDTSNPSDSVVYLADNSGSELSTWTNSGNVFVGGTQTSAGGPATVFVNDGSQVDIGRTVKIWGSGKVDMSGGELSADVVDHNAGGAFDLLGGTLQVNQFHGDLLNQGGTLSPGPSAGATTISGDYTQQSTATLAIDIGGTGPGGTHDLVNIGGQATIDGLLELSLINGFLPGAADEFTVLGSSSLLGLFDNVTTGQRLTTSDGLGSFVVNYGLGSAYDESRIVLSDFLAMILSGDYDGNGLVGAGDLNLVLGAWGEDVTATGIPSGWINEQPTGLISAAELNIVLNNWGTSSTMLAAVPEPSSAVLILLGLVGLFRSKHSSE